MDSKGSTVNSVQVLVKDKPFGDMRSMVEAFYLDSQNSDFEGCEFFLETDGGETQLKDTDKLDDLIELGGAVPTLRYKRKSDVAPSPSDLTLSHASSTQSNSSMKSRRRSTTRTEVIQLKLFPSPSTNKLKPVILTVSANDTAEDVLNTIVRTKLQAMTNHKRRSVLAGKAGQPPKFLQDAELVLPYVDQGHTIVVSVDPVLWEHVLEVFVGQKALVYHMRIVHRWLRGCQKSKAQKSDAMVKEQLRNQRQAQFKALRETPEESEPTIVSPKHKPLTNHKRPVAIEKQRAATKSPPKSNDPATLEASKGDTQAELKKLMRKAELLEKENNKLKQESEERRRLDFEQAHAKLKAREPKETEGPCRSCAACIIA